MINVDQRRFLAYMQAKREFEDANQLTPAGWFWVGYMACCLTVVVGLHVWGYWEQLQAVLQ